METGRGIRERLGQTLQCKHPSEAHGARTVLLAGHPPGRPEPERQELAGILKDRLADLGDFAGATT